ncbi:MAG: hypothetical protein O7B35_15720 [Deltaproteobacteria bacterium]|nr:hypothetical protein [Deltaproteobacteria bacterium]
MRVEDFHDAPIQRSIFHCHKMADHPSGKPGGVAEQARHERAASTVKGYMAILNARGALRWVLIVLN